MPTPAAAAAPTLLLPQPRGPARGELAAQVMGAATLLQPLPLPLPMSAD